MIKFQVERATDILEEIKPLLAAHWDEVALYKDQFPLNPDYEKYKALDAQGIAHVVTARDDEELIGYYISFIMPHPHFQDCILALNDIVFVKKEYRRGNTGRELIAFAEQELQKLGVHRILIHVTKQRDFSPLLKRMGFTEQGTDFEKLLDRRAE